MIDITKEMVDIINRNRIDINEAKVDVIPVNQDILKASDSVIPRGGRRKKSHLLAEGNYQIQELFIPAIRVIKQAITPEKDTLVSERMLDASKYIIDQVKGKARAAVDVTHDVTPYNWVIRQLEDALESTHSPLIEEGDGIVLIEEENNV